MKIKLILVTVFIVCSTAACSSTSQKVASSKNEVKIDDGYKTTKKGEVIIDGRDTASKEKPLLTAQYNSIETPQAFKDGSDINTMLDGYGNKTFTRNFYNDTLIKQIVLRVFASGQKKVFVYAQNGDVKSLPDEMLDKVLTAPVGELARAAGIFEGRNENNLPYFLQILRPKPIELISSETVNTSFMIRSPVFEQKSTDLPRDSTGYQNLTQTTTIAAGAPAPSQEDLQRQINWLQMQKPKTDPARPQEARTAANKPEIKD